MGTFRKQIQIEAAAVVEPGSNFKGKAGDFIVLDANGTWFVIDRDKFLKEYRPIGKAARDVLEQSNEAAKAAGRE